ncbi:MAG: hypothetical protein KC586_15445, partial [Myxococcales bacterium]|nr:hypothetical protein [Myxococcales bacterium]
MLLFAVAVAFGLFAELLARHVDAGKDVWLRRGLFVGGLCILALREVGEYALHRFRTDPVGDDPPIH